MQVSRLPRSDVGRVDRLQGTAPLDTTEVRWFAAGPPPSQLVERFCDTGSSVDLEIRNDAYLANGSHHVGLKRRNGGPLELKARRQSSDFVAMGRAVGAPVEEWRKFIGIRPGITGSDSTWIDVTKVVLTSTYGYLSDGGVGPAQAGYDEPGCDIELASVTAASSDAWTFALEAWGPAKIRLPLLREALARFWDACPLSPEQTAALTSAMGYPEWLARTAVPRHVL